MPPLPKEALMLLDRTCHFLATIYRGAIKFEQRFHDIKIVFENEDKWYCLTVDEIPFEEVERITAERSMASASGKDAKDEVFAIKNGMKI